MIRRKCGGWIFSKIKRKDGIEIMSEFILFLGFIREMFFAWERIANLNEPKIME